MKKTISLLTLGCLIAPSSAFVYSSGHGDIGVAYEDGGLFLHYHLGEDEHDHEGEEHGEEEHEEEEHGEEEHGMELEPSEVTTVVPQIPGTTQFILGNAGALNTGTGVAPGSSLWVLPQGSVEGIPFLGFSSEELSATLFPDGATFNLMSVTSPSGSGHFSAYQGDGAGGFNFFFSTADDSVADSIPSAGGHDHFNLGFSEPGMWQFELSVTADLVDGGTITPLSDTETFNFQVIPEPSTALLGFLGALGLLRRRR